MTTTRTAHTIARRLRTAGVVATAAAGLAAAAPAAHADTVVGGNACYGPGIIQSTYTAGAEACMIRNKISATALDLQFGAHDYGPDKNSVLTEARVSQSAGPGHSFILTVPWRTVRNTGGLNTTGLSDWTRIYKAKGTYVRLELRACTVDPKGVRQACITKVSVKRWV